MDAAKVEQAKEWEMRGTGHRRDVPKGGPGVWQALWSIGWVCKPRGYKRTLAPIPALR